MEQYISSFFRLGIISGGQLGKLIAQHAAQWDIETFVMDNSSNCPAALVSKFQQGSAQNFEDVYHFGKTMDLLLLEMENVNLEALQKLEDEGVKVYPTAKTLAIIRDKWIQKQFLINHNIPVSEGIEIKNKNHLNKLIKSGNLKTPLVLKSKVGGYDGKGVQMIRETQEVEVVITGDFFAEKLIDLAKELSVIVVRDKQGNTRCYDPVDMVFDQESNLLDYLVYPAEIEDSISDEAKKISEKIISKLEHIGLLAIEFFLTKTGDLIVNEIAPRPHNSGHQSIESSYTSQYEQLLRATLGAPLGHTKVKVPSILYNITGEVDSEGRVSYEGLSEIMEMSNVNIHIYGKRTVKPFRKMGHLVIYGNQMLELKEQLKVIKKTLKVHGK